MRLTILAIFLCLTLPAFAHAQESEEARVDRIVFGGVRYNPSNPNPRNYRDSVRFEVRLASQSIWRFHPWAGLEFMSYGASWGGAGLETDINLLPNLFLTLQSGFGYFDDGTQHTHYNVYPEQGFKFRSTVELGYQITDNGARLGLGWSHISNAGIDEHNAGINAALFTVHVPLIPLK